MSCTKIMASIAIVGLLSTAANAQVRTVNELPVTYTDAGVIKAQHIKPGDVSPEEYQRLLNEADKIRAFRSNSGAYSDSYSGVIVDSEASVDTFGHSQPAATSYATTTDSYGYEIQLFDGPVTSQAVTMQPATTTFASTAAYDAAYASPSYTAAQSHTVLKGDTIYNISKRFNVNADDLRSANGISGNNIQLNQVLTIPGQSVVSKTQSYSTVPTTNFASTYQTNDYVDTNAFSTNGSQTVRAVQPIETQNSARYAVLPGDNLYRISRMACTSVDSIQSANGITDVTTLQPGQMLKMPEGHCLNQN